MSPGPGRRRHRSARLERPLRPARAQRPARTGGLRLPTLPGRPDRPGGPGRRLDGPARRLLACGSLYNAGMATSTVFVSLFFYIATGSVAGMVMFSVGRYLGLIGVSLGVVRFAPRVPPSALLKVGIGLNAGFFVLLIVAGHGVAAAALPIGLVSGSALGVYWFGNNSLVYDLVRPGERGRYYGLSFTLLSLMNVVMPLVAGNLITGIGGERGYLAVFAIALVGFAAAAWLSRPIEDRGGIGGVAVGEALALPASHRTWGRMWVAVVLRGFKQASGGIGMIVLVAAAAHSAAAQGEYAAVTAMAAVVTSGFAGGLRGRNRVVAMWVGAVGFSVSTVMLYTHLDLAVLLGYGAASGLVYPGLMIPINTIVLEAMDHDPGAAERRGGYVLSREVGANLGRLAALGAILLGLTVAGAVPVVLAVLSAAALAQLVVAYLGASSRPVLSHAG